MDILIIGGSGHVSGSLTRKALEHGHKVWTVTRGTKNVDSRATALIADRHNLESFRSVIEDTGKAWDMVVDCICYETANMKQDIELFKNRARQFVFISTDFVYDPAFRKFPQAEETEYYIREAGLESLSYGFKKRCCELELLNRNMGNSEWTILRPCHIYGPSSELGCLPLHGRDPELIDKILAGKALRLVSGGYHLQQPLFVEDLAEAILSIAGNEKTFRNIFNIAGPDIIESRYYYKIIADILGVELKTEEVPVAEFLSQNPGLQPFICHRIYDLAKLKNAGLCIPSTPIEKGLLIHTEGLRRHRKNKLS